MKKIILVIVVKKKFSAKKEKSEMAIGTKVSVGVMVAASSLANCRTTLSLVQFHLPLLRPRLPSAGPLHNLPLAHVSNLIKSGYCIQTSQEKNNYTRSCKQRAFFGDGGLELHDAGATALVVAGAYTLVSTFDKLTSANLIQQVSFLFCGQGK